MGRCGVKGRVAWKACCRVHRHVLHKLGLHLWSSQEVYAFIFINTPPYTLYCNQQSFRFLRIYICRGTHATGNFEKKTRKQQQSMNKAFWSHFKHFGRLLGKNHLFLTPSRTDRRVPSEQGAPTLCNLTYWEVSQQTYVQKLQASLLLIIRRINTT